jgi:hypothetical protein
MLRAPGDNIFLFVPLNNILDHGMEIGKNRKNRDTPVA